MPIGFNAALYYQVEGMIQIQKKIEPFDIGADGEDEHGYPEQGEKALRKVNFGHMLCQGTYPKLIGTRLLIIDIKVGLAGSKGDHSAQFLGRL
jgi:hypothetical protein